MKLAYFLSGKIELNSLAKSGVVDINIPEVINGVFYEAMKNEVSLDAMQGNFIDLFGDVELSPQAMLLLVKIAASSLALESINISNNNLGEYGPAIAAELAKSYTLKSINMSGCNLGEYGPAMAAELAKLPTLQVIDMSGCNLGEYGPATAAELAKSDALEINMSANNLGAHGPATAAELAKSDALEINMSGNNLGAHGPVTAAELAKSDALKSVNIGDNNLGAHGLATAVELAKSYTLKSINMSDNNLGENAIEAINVVFRAHNDAHEVDMEVNKLVHETLAPVLRFDLIDIVGEYSIMGAHIDVELDDM